MSNFLQQIRIEVPGPLLDATYKGSCSCGVRKDFGYMVITANRWADRHRDLGHDVIMTETETTPLDRQKILKKIRSRGRVHDMMRTAVEAADT